MYLEYYLMGIILLPGLIFAIIAQARVQSTFNHYKHDLAKCEKTATEVARQILDASGLSDVRITSTSGELTDYYDPKAKTIALSDSTRDSTSVASIGVAAHEVGHALQYRDGYFPVKLRSIIIPMVNISSRLLWPLVAVGLVLNLALVPDSLIGLIFAYSGIGFFALSALLSLITLPVEYNASSRAYQALRSTGILTPDEADGAKKVLNSAALTYVASLVVSMLDLLRFILFIVRANSDK